MGCCLGVESRCVSSEVCWRNVWQGRSILRVQEVDSLLLHGLRLFKQQTSYINSQIPGPS
jgi:hypothetical protein